MNELEKKLAAIEAALNKFLEKRNEEIVLQGKASEETKKTLETLGNQWKETAARLLQVEQALVSRNPGAPGAEQPKSLGTLMTESEGFKALQGGAARTGKIKVGSLYAGMKVNMINAPGPLQPLVPDVRVPGIIRPGLRRLTIRDLMPNNRTVSNLIQYTVETAFTNAAAPQPGEGVDKAQSNMTFALQNAPVQTLAHWIAASRQLLDDAPAIEDYINSRLMYGLKLVEEDQLLKGNGTGQNISGLLTNSTAYTRGSGGDTDIDCIRKAKTQVTDSFFEPDGVVLHPHDWERIELTKTTIGNYVVSVPQEGAPPRLWGLDVVPTPAIPVGTFLVGAFQPATAVWDRMDATLEISREHASFFTQNMVAVLVEERLALTVFRPIALVSGTLPVTGS